MIILGVLAKGMLIQILMILVILAILVDTAVVPADCHMFA